MRVCGLYFQIAFGYTIFFGGGGWGVLGRKFKISTHIYIYTHTRSVLWALARGKLQKSSFVTEEFFMLARHKVHRLGGKDLELWPITSWSLWNARNRFQFKHVQTHPCEIFKQADSLLEEYQRLARSLPQRWYLRLRCSHAWFCFFIKKKKKKQKKEESLERSWSYRSIVLSLGRPLVVKLLGRASFCFFFWLIYFYHFSQKKKKEKRKKKTFNNIVICNHHDPVSIMWSFWMLFFFKV